MVRAYLSRFFSWWLYKLGDLFPKAIKDIFSEDYGYAEVTFDDVSNPTISKRGTIILPQEFLRKDIDFENSEPRIVNTVLPQAFFFKRSISIPLEAFSNKEKFIAADISLNYPTKFDDLTYIEAPVRWEPGMAIFTYFVGPSQKLNRLTDRLLNLNLKPRAYFLTFENRRLKIPAKNKDKNPLLSLGRFNQLAAVALIAFFPLSAIYTANEKSNQIENLQSQNKALLNRILVQKNEQDQLRQSGEAASVLRKQFETAFRLTNFIDALTQAMPDSVWISNLQYSENRVQFEGVITGSASELVLDLNKNAAFENVSLAGPTSISAQGQERFRIALELVNQ